MHITIRKVQPSDASAVSALSGQLGYSMSQPDSLAAIHAINDSNSDVAYVAISGNAIIGWMHVFHTLRLESKPWCEIGGLVIDEQNRGRGAGSVLVNEAVNWCREKQCTKLRVRSNAIRDDAHQFYLNAGFTNTKQQKVFEIPVDLTPP